MVDHGGQRVWGRGPQRRRHQLGRPIPVDHIPALTPVDVIAD
jgi:hypothetical protein